MKFLSRTAGVLFTVVGTLAVLRLLGVGQRRWADQPPLLPLRPEEPGMTLRQVYDTFPVAETVGLRFVGANPEGWVERWRLLAEANETLDVTYFILDQDLFGIAFLGHLLQRAEDGVQIRLLLDGLGTKMSLTPRGNDYLDELVNTGQVRIRMYRPLLTRYLEGLLKLSLTVAVASEHDKMVLADGARGLVGGRNIAEEYFVRPDEPTPQRAYLDADVIVESARFTGALGQVFEAAWASPRTAPVKRERANLVPLREELLLAWRLMDDWLRRGEVDPEVRASLRDLGLPWAERIEQHPTLRGALGSARPPAVVAEARLLDTPVRFGVPDDPVTQALGRLVRAAEHRILVQSPYLVLAEPAVRVLEEASRRGVEIVMLTNGPLSSDNPVSQALFLEQWPELLARVPTMRLFVASGPSLLHAKLATFDDQVALVGTYNLDPSSMAVNSELVVAVWSETFAHQVAAWPLGHIRRGHPHVVEYQLLRDAHGNALRDARGRPLVAVGPEQHPEDMYARWPRIAWYRRLVRALHGLGRMRPVM